MLAFAACAYCLLVFWQATAMGQVPISVPLTYEGDGLQYSFIIEAFSSHDGVGRIINAGAPFGTQNLDFPNADFSNLLLASLVAGDGHFGERLNLYLLLSVALTSFASFFTARRFGLRPLWAAIVAVAFTLLPFHFLRIPHLFYTNYSAAAVAVWIALQVAAPSNDDDEAPLWKRRLRLAGFALGCAWCASTGVYYAFFSCIVIASAGLLAAVRDSALAPVRRAALPLLIIVGTVGLQLLPTLVFVQEQGINERVAKRSFQESEVYGLRVTQLVLPSANHRLGRLANIRNRYDQQAPNVNENSTATLGVFGAFGFAAAILLVLAPRLRDRLRWPYELSAALLLILLLFATIGGFGTLFALLVTPQMRALNRISPFIALLAALIAAGVLQTIIDRFRFAMAHSIVAVIALIGIVYDQVPVGMGEPNPRRQADKVRFDDDRAFARIVTANLADGAAVMQLPYIDYPEAGSSIGDYTQFRNHLHAPSIRWTHGAMKGRPEGNWLAMVSALPPQLFAQTLRAAGFSGVVVDERGGNEFISSQAQAFAATGPSRKFTSKDKSQTGYLVSGVPSPIGVAISPARGWYAPERSADAVWIWSSGDASLQLSEATRAPCTARITLTSLRPQRVSAKVDGRLVGFVEVTSNTNAVLTMPIPVGTRTVLLGSDTPAASAGTDDPRVFGFQWKVVDAPVCVPGAG
ncbi:hypothetical protein HIV01_010320 [Lysobacter arenosi]|uniref:Sugar translocase n=1 Tax=Lysobacter arenosi TaxID=2795387 RepID=A0ABX7R8A5_9GAMM|nr:hypothetical protein [Lysobacter arenosi]QSX73637.1 hypothetical protein HIV01_010320 [Lysobacter arenosi]